MEEKIKAARKQLGGFLKQRREQLGLTTDELGGLVGFTGNTIRGVESGRFAMDIDMQFKIYQALGIKPYFSFQDQPPEGDYRLRKIDDKDRYHGFYISENLLLYPGQLAIIKLTHPRLFVKFNYGASYFSSYEDWKANHTEMQWLDPDDKPEGEEIEYHLTDCWNFLALHEREEERLADEIDEDEDNDY